MKLHQPGAMLLVWGLTLSLIFALAPLAEAVIVDSVIGAGSVPVDPSPVNTSAPSDSLGDPGWHRTPVNRSAIYLGNQWVLSATHAGFGRVELPGGSYDLIPGSDIILSNQSTPFGSTNLSTNSDLRMWRIRPDSTTGLTPEQADPNLAGDPFGAGNVKIASSAPGVGSTVRMIGRGRDRTVNTSDPNGHTTVGAFVGIQGNSNLIKTWGDNRLDATTRIPVEIFGRHAITFSVQFDSSLYNYSNKRPPVPNEAQGASGDSGGPVFFKRNGQWELVGVMHGIGQEEGQAGTLAAFGNDTFFTDLSQAHYRNQINALLANDFDAFESASGLTTDLTGYSINGDINLDGVVSGDGTGSITTDDVAAFVSGWRHQQATADVYSWQKGDLNLDGRTDLSDFALLRDAFNGSISASQLSTLIGVTATPEPSTLALATLAAAGLLGRRRRI